MSTGSFFGNPWGDDDSSQPQSFFGGPLRDAMRWQSAGWGNPLLSLAGQPSYPGSLVPPGASFANLARPMTQLAANVVTQPDGGAPGTADPGPAPTPPVGQIDDQTRADFDRDAGEQLKEIGHIAGFGGRAIGMVPGLETVGRVIEGLAQILENQFTRGPIAHVIGKATADSIQGDFDRANNAYGQQQLLNSGGMPHR